MSKEAGLEDTLAAPPNKREKDGETTMSKAAGVEDTLAAPPNKREKEGEEHDFTSVYIANSGPISHHGRRCKKCGRWQNYGRLYGSNKYPGYEIVDPKCPGGNASSVKRKKTATEIEDTLAVPPNKREKDGEEHDFSFEYLVNSGPISHHQRRCKNCGLIQEYGWVFGSNRQPGFYKVDPKCPGGNAFSAWGVDFFSKKREDGIEDRKAQAESSQSAGGDLSP